MARLTEGAIAPDFATVDHFGAAVSLEAYRGRKLLLSFYRYASCPLCNMRVNAMIGRYEAWNQAGLEVVGVFQSPAQEIRRYVGRQDAPFPIVPDPQMRLYRRYGVEASWLGFVRGGLRLPLLAGALRNRFYPGKLTGPINRIPADFLIDEAGRLIRCYYGKDAGDHLPFDEIEAWVGMGSQFEPALS